MSIAPPWSPDWKPIETPPGLSTDDGKWKPGQSGNPAGRPAGTLNKRTRVAVALDEAGEDVALAVIAEAKGGDMQAAKLVLERIQPPMRPRAEKVEFDLDPEKPLTSQAQQVLVAVATGKLDPDTGKLLIDCLSAFAGLREHDELASRIGALEQNAQASATTQGVLGRVMHTTPETAT